MMQHELINFWKLHSILWWLGMSILGVNLNWSAKQRFATPEDLWESMGLSVESRNDSMYSILNLEDYSEHPVLPQQHLQDQQGLRKSDVHTARKTFLAKGLSYRVIRGSAGLIGHGEGEQWTLTQFPHSLDVFEGFSPSLCSPVLESVKEFFQFLAGVR